MTSLVSRDASAAALGAEMVGFVGEKAFFLLLFCLNFFCPRAEPARTRRDTQKCTMDLVWDSVWEPDGEPADVPEPLWTVGPEVIEPLPCEQDVETMPVTAQTRVAAYQTPKAWWTSQQPQERKEEERRRAEPRKRSLEIGAKLPHSKLRAARLS